MGICRRYAIIVSDKKYIHYFRYLTGHCGTTDIFFNLKGFTAAHQKYELLLSDDNFVVNRAFS